MLGLLGILCSASPITLAAHFVPSAADLGDRASTFFFLPLALSCSLVVMRDPRVGQYSPSPRRHASAILALLICVTSVAYTGGVLLGSGPDWEKLPGPYLVSADPAHAGCGDPGRGQVGSSAPPARRGGRGRPRPC